MSMPNYKFQGTRDGIQISVVDDLHDSFLHQGHEDVDDDEEEELIRVASRRNPLGLSAAACCDGKVRKTFSMRADDQDEKQSCSSSGIEKAVRRAFSMRASSVSSSVNEVYRRIDHQYEPVPPVADEKNTIMAAQTGIESDHKKRNKFLEACRRLFGF